MLLVLATGLLAQNHRESVLLLTDRGHYISGESIQYRVFYWGPAESKGRMEQVLYVELITPNGAALVQGKIPIDTGVVKGSHSDT